MISSGLNRYNSGNNIATIKYHMNSTMLLLWTLSALLAAAQASVWPYHGSVGWVPATGTSYGAAPSVALSEAYAQSNAHAHATSVAGGSNNIYTPIYYKGLGSQSAVSSASAHSSVGSAISKGSAYVAAPSRGPVTIVGPSLHPVSVIGSNSGSAVANSIAGGGSAGATAVIGPTSVPVSVVGPSSGPVYITGSGDSSASAHAHANSAYGIASSGASIGPSTGAVYVKAPVAPPIIYRAPIVSPAPVIVKSRPEPVIWCPPEVSEWKLPKPIAIFPSRVDPIVVAGPSAGSVAITGPTAPSAIISGPSGTIATSGGSAWPGIKYW